MKRLIKLKRVKRFPIQIVDEMLKRAFYRLGVYVGSNPGYFVIVPLLLTALCATGFQRMVYNYDPEYLLSPSEGQAKSERAIMEKYFPTDYNSFKATRMSRVGKFGRLILTAKDGGSVLRSDLFREVVELDQQIMSISVPGDDEGVNLTYTDICAKWNGACRENEVLHLVDIVAEIEAGDFNLSYPITFHPYTFRQYILPEFFGGFDLDEELGLARSIKALSLTYFLDVSTEQLEAAGEAWERSFIALMNSDAGTEHLNIAKFVSSTPAWEMEASKNSITPNLLINVVVMIIFCMVATSMADAVRSKPLIGFMGLFVACLATMAAFGFVCYMGCDFIALCFAAPFLLLGIGIDDTFVMLSAWYRAGRTGDPALTVPERLGRTFSEAAVSITVTSLTDFFSFFAGVITPFPCVKIFCIYTGTAVGFIYIWHLTLFGACLALAGRAEAKNKHGFLFCVQATPRSQASHKPLLYRLFCTGGTSPADPYNPEDNKDHAGMVFFRDKFGATLSKTWVKACVLAVFCIYMAGAIWGILNIHEGLEKRNTVNYDSYSINYYNMEDKYFMEYRFPVNLILSPATEDGYLTISDVRMQERIEEIVQRFESSKFISPNMTTSWLRNFLDFVDRNQDYDDMKKLLADIDTEAGLIQALNNVYMSDGESTTGLDVNISPDGQRIKAVRFLLQGHKVENAVQETEFLVELRKICAEASKDGLKVTVFHPFFIYIDQYLEIMPQTVQSVLVTSAFMMVISFIMIPNPVCSLWVGFSIISIEAGVVGYMTWWGVNLDGIALINLIMCIGFSVDFSAHISYHYMSEGKEFAHSVAERVSQSLYSLGLPILQGAISTILGVIGLAFAKSYLYITFFKMIFLVIFLGALHGIILLPVLLSMFGPGSCSRKGKEDNERHMEAGSSSSIQGHPSPAASVSSSVASTWRRALGGRGQQKSCYTINLAVGATTGQSSKQPHGVTHAEAHHQAVGHHHQPATLHFSHPPNANLAALGTGHFPTDDEPNSASLRQFRKYTSEFDDTVLPYNHHIHANIIVHNPQEQYGNGHRELGPTLSNFGGNHGGPMTTNNNPRLTPVPESEEHYDSIAAQLERRKLSRTTSIMPTMIHAPSANNGGSSISGRFPVTSTHSLPLTIRAKDGGMENIMAMLTPVSRTHSNSSAAGTLAANMRALAVNNGVGDAVEASQQVNMGFDNRERLALHSNQTMALHKKLVSRSKSHRPQSDYTAVLQASSAAQQAPLCGDKLNQLLAAKGVMATKQPLRKYHSFPYHILKNDTGYASSTSSDDTSSVKSDITEDGGGGCLNLKVR